MRLTLSGFLSQVASLVKPGHRRFGGMKCYPGNYSLSNLFSLFTIFAIFDRIFILISIDCQINQSKCGLMWFEPDHLPVLSI